MKKSLTIGQQVAAGFALPIIILVVLSTVTYNSTQRLMETSYWVTHTHQVLAEISDLYADLQDVESGTRGFVISGKDEYLEPFRTGSESVPKRYKRVAELVSDSALQRRRIDDVDAVIKERIEHATQAIELRRTEGIDVALKHVNEGGGQRAMAAIRAAFKEMTVREHELLQIRAQESERASAQLTRILVGGTTAALILVMAAATFTAPWSK